MQLLGVSGPLSKKFGLEIFMGERRTTVKFSRRIIVFDLGNQLRARPCQLGACAHTSCNYVENLKVSVLQLPSVLRLEDATELQFPCTSRHDCVKILKLVLKIGVRQKWHGRWTIQFWDRHISELHGWCKKFSGSTTRWLFQMITKSVQHIDLPIIKLWAQKECSKLGLVCSEWREEHLWWWVFCVVFETICFPLE